MSSFFGERLQIVSHRMMPSEGYRTALSLLPHFNALSLRIQE
jgi:hypothetical protein